MAAPEQADGRIGRIAERRALLSAAAWAAPVIAVTMAAPAQAASGTESPS
ncbi:hypothetical protein [Pseudoclavibacter sp. RFBA6]|nr:hypothetical protein [Pseudoclavibacter sp. RFBA6]